MNAQVNADASLQAHLQSAQAVESRASGLRSEWRIASYTVRFSAICLAIFYLLAGRAPYEPTTGHTLRSSSTCLGTSP